MDVTIRPATEADVGFLTDVVVEATFHQGRLPEDFDEAGFRAGFAEWTAEQVRGELDGSVTSVVQVDGVDAGRLRLVRRPDLLEVAGLQLLPEHQSHGVGRTVVSQVLAQARAAGVPVELGVEKDNPRARAFWERCGFAYVGEDEGEHRLRRALTSPTVTPVLVAELLVEDGRMPVYVHVIDHPDARVLVDTGLTQLHPAVADMDPRLVPPSEQAGLDPAAIDLVVNTHLHFDHCGGNHLFTGKPIYVQRRELDDARSLDDYTIREWVDVAGADYVPVDGTLELLPGIRLVPAPGHTRGSQVVVVETSGGAVVVAGDTAVFHAELDEPQTEGQRLVRALGPAEVWLSHEHQPWRPRHP